MCIRDRFLIGLIDLLVFPSAIMNNCSFAIIRYEDSGGDYPVIQTYVLLIGVLFVVFNLLFDILQTISDPRMRKEGM